MAAPVRLPSEWVRKVALILVAAAAALTFSPSAAARQRHRHPSYQWCVGHRCTRPHRAWYVRCPGYGVWLSPRPVRHCTDPYVDVPSF